MLEKVVLVILAALVGAAVSPWLEWVRGNWSAQHWEAQERWKFKADTYARALVALKQMRQPLERPATKGILPSKDEWDKVVQASLDLVEPVVVGRLWLDEEATRPLETLGNRLMDVARTIDKQDPGPTLVSLCRVLDDEINRLHELARKDLRFERLPRRRREERNDEHPS